MRFGTLELCGDREQQWKWMCWVARAWLEQSWSRSSSLDWALNNILYGNSFRAESQLHFSLSETLVTGIYGICHTVPLNATFGCSPTIGSTAQYTALRLVVSCRPLIYLSAEDIFHFICINPHSYEKVFHLCLVSDSVGISCASDVCKSWIGWQIWLTTEMVEEMPKT